MKTLSDKIFGNDYRYGELIEDKQAIWIEDVKQFIKDLKKYFTTKQSKNYIDKLAGKELVE